MTALARAPTAPQKTMPPHRRILQAATVPAAAATPRTTTPPHRRVPQAAAFTPAPTPAPATPQTTTPPHRRVLQTAAPAATPAPAPVTPTFPQITTPPHRRILQAALASAALPALLTTTLSGTSSPVAVLAPLPAAPAPQITTPPHRRVLQAAAAAPATPQTATPPHWSVHVSASSGTRSPVNASALQLPPPTSPQAHHPEQAEALLRIKHNQEHSLWPKSLIAKYFRFSQFICYHHQEALRWHASDTLLTCEKHVVPHCHE